MLFSFDANRSWDRHAPACDAPRQPGPVDITTQISGPGGTMELAGLGMGMGDVGGHLYWRLGVLNRTELRKGMDWPQVTVLREAQSWFRLL